MQKLDQDIEEILTDIPPNMEHFEDEEKSGIIEYHIIFRYGSEEI